MIYAKHVFSSLWDLYVLRVHIWNLVDSTNKQKILYMSFFFWWSFSLLEDVTCGSSLSSLLLTLMSWMGDSKDIVFFSVVYCAIKCHTYKYIYVYTVHVLTKLLLKNKGKQAPWHLLIIIFCDASASLLLGELIV